MKPGTGRAPVVGAGGFRLVPHTADLRIEAWGATREECIVQAVRGLVASFAEAGGARQVKRVTAHLGDRAAEDLLVAALDEVIYRLDADGEVPVAVAARRCADGGADLTLGLAPLGSVTVVGAGPKAVSLHELRCSPGADGRWSASVTVDV